MSWVEKLDSGHWRGGYIDVTGRKRQKGGFLHRKAAKDWADDGEEAARRGLTFDARAGRTELRDWAQRWHAARRVEMSTAVNEKPRYDAIIDKWGDWPIASIGSLDIEAWLTDLTVPEGGKVRAPATIRKYFMLLSKIMADAIRPPHRLISENPCRFVTLPPLPSGREVYLTREEADRLDGKLEVPDSTLVWLLLYSGLRWGEAVGLHANRVDFLRRQISVVDVIGQSNGGYHYKAYPKSKKPRVVPIPDHLVERLSAHMKAFPSRPCGLHSACRGLMFTVAPRWGGELHPVNRQTFDRHRFDPAVAEAGLPSDLRLHDLRHTYASWLVQAGVPLREVQYLLGHASMATTERYSHLAPDVGQHARSVLETPPASAVSAIRGNIRGNAKSDDGY